MTDIFYHSKLSVRRAQEHILDLQGKISAFIDIKPYAHVTESDPDGVNKLHKIKFIKPLPYEFASITADTVNNLRSSLDQAWYAVAVVCKAIGITGEAYFPIANSVADFEGMLRKRWAKNFHPDILALLRRLQPYKGGNDLIWALNRICTTNKHRMLSPIGITGGGMHIGYLKMYGPGQIPAPKWDIAKQEIVFAITGPGTSFEYRDLNLSFYIAFDDVDVVGGYPVLGILRNLLSIVNGIVRALEAETQRLGFI
jgi:hypothetical protein